MFNLFKRKTVEQPIPEQTLEDKLEIEKQDLISDLKNNGMEFLVTQMKNNEVYSGLILEQREITQRYSSEDRISWHAYQQSDSLHSEDDKKELLGMLKNEKFGDYHDEIFCCLANICANTQDRDLFNFLIDIVDKTKDEKIRVSILTRLEDVKKDSGYNITPIKNLIQLGTSDEIYAAIKALSNSIDPEIEDFLLGEFKTSDRHKQHGICSPLATVGTLKSIPVLREAHKKTRDNALRFMIEDAISVIEEREKSRG
ncbi:MAG: hypothetical protein GC181_11530 [Bacteroidetes bacterium]|nr:hypothetical protein [Bacteroidota bacterium]